MSETTIRTIYDSDGNIIPKYAEILEKNIGLNADQMDRIKNHKTTTTFAGYENGKEQLPRVLGQTISNVYSLLMNRINNVLSSVTDTTNINWINILDRPSKISDFKDDLSEKGYVKKEYVDKEIDKLKADIVLSGGTVNGFSGVTIYANNGLTVNGSGYAKGLFFNIGVDSPYRIPTRDELKNIGSGGRDTYLTYDYNTESLVSEYNFINKGTFEIKKALTLLDALKFSDVIETVEEITDSDGNVTTALTKDVKTNTLSLSGRTGILYYDGIFKTSGLQICDKITFLATSGTTTQALDNGNVTTGPTEDIKTNILSLSGGTDILYYDGIFKTSGLQICDKVVFLTTSGTTDQMLALSGDDKTLVYNGTIDAKLEWNNILNKPEWAVDDITWDIIKNKPLWIGDVKPKYTYDEVGAVSSAITINGSALTKNLTIETGSSSAITNETYTLSVTGGTIGGNLQLKTGIDYGTKIIFGDGEYVYLHEDVDDHLKIHARKGIELGYVEKMFMRSGSTSNNFFTYDYTNGALKYDGNLYVTGGLSALGIKSDINGNAVVSGLTATAITTSRLNVINNGRISFSNSGYIEWSSASGGTVSISGKDFAPPLVIDGQGVTIEYLTINGTDIIAKNSNKDYVNLYKCIKAIKDAITGNTMYSNAVTNMRDDENLKKLI